MDFALDNDGFCAKMMNSAVNASLGLGMSSAPAGIYDYESARYLVANCNLNASVL